MFTDNDTSTRVEGIRTFRLLLNTGHFVDLIDTFVVPTLRCNLVFVSTMDSYSYSLWHKRLDHISQKIIDRLVIEGVLQPFDGRDIEKCVSCIKDKNTHTTGKGYSRAT